MASPRALVCPDKYRGSLSAHDAAAAIGRGLRRSAIETRLLPLADGGEGTLDVLLEGVGGELRTATVTGPLGNLVNAAWALLVDGTAVVEMARASGHGVGGRRRDPRGATTFGTGELIAAAGREAARIVVCLGGSATTDGGLGAVEALGWRLPSVPVALACDVETTFLDAARVYGPQKGASPADVRFLEDRLRAIAGTYRDRLGLDVTALPGSGAAGGLGGGLAALGATVERGFELVADTLGLRAAMEGADLIITGEGALDPTSFAGKVIGGVLRTAPSGSEVHAIVGRATAEGIERASGVVRVRTLLERAGDAGVAMRDAARLLEEIATEIGHEVVRTVTMPGEGPAKDPEVDP